MQHYLSSTQVAERLGLSRDALNARIRANDFVEPDVMVGRYQGWSEETIQQVEAEGGNGVRIDSEKLFGVVTSLRRAAERVRAFGHVPEAAGDVHISIPSDLHVLAGRLEAETRSWLAVRDYIGKSFSQVGGDIAAGVTRIDVEFEPVPTIVDSPGLPADVRALELHAAADDLLSAAGEIRLALVVKSSRHYQEALLKKAAQIHDFAEKLLA